MKWEKMPSINPKPKSVSKSCLSRHLSLSLSLTHTLNRVEILFCFKETNPKVSYASVLRTVLLQVFAAKNFGVGQDPRPKHTFFFAE